jgi:hypothetical protein
LLIAAADDGFVTSNLTSERDDHKRISLLSTGIDYIGCGRRHAASEWS